MPQQTVNKEYNTFVKGLNTEAGPLTYPENASLSEDNFELNTKGYRSRRLGIDYESEYTLIDSGNVEAEFIDKAVNVTKWEDVNTNGSLIILVVQIGLDLFFYDATKQPVTGTPLNGGNPITLEGDKGLVFQTANVSGNFAVVTGGDVIYQLFYNSTDDEVTFIQHGLLVRDIWGVADGTFISERIIPGGEDTDLVAYNLHNQGWGEKNIDDNNVSYRATFFFDEGVYPSNSDKVSSGVDSADGNQFKPTLVLRAISGTSPAPKGSHIIDLFYRGASRTISFVGLNNTSGEYSLLNNYGTSSLGWDLPDSSGNKVYGVHSSVAGQVTIPSNLQITLPVDRTAPSIRAVAAYSGRLFYAGFDSTVIDGDSRSPNLATYVTYSQIIENEEKVGKCYQEGDPGSVTDFDLVATDGGVIHIPGISSIVKMIPFGRSLVVFATNGVWEIRGGEDGFSATSNSVEKISDIGTTNAGSVVEAENRILYWATDGIYAIDRDQVGFNLTSVSLSENTIQSLYSDISSSAKSNVTAEYSGSTKTISWMYNDLDNYDGVTDKFVYNRQLNFNMTLQAFYTYTIGSDTTDTEYPRVAGIFLSTDFISQRYEEQVVIGDDFVQIDGENVVISRDASTNTPIKTSYLVVKPDDTTNYTFSVAALTNPSFLDWESDVSDSVDAEGHLEAGFETLQDTQRKKQTQYVTVHCERTEDGFDSDLEPTSPSSCFMQAKWDFADSENSGKISTPVQVYRLRRDYIPSGTGDTFDYGQSVISTKNKIRGRGRALVLRFSTEPARNCILYGWATTFAANKEV